jgi:hypothetical protein
VFNSSRVCSTSRRWLTLTFTATGHPEGMLALTEPRNRIGKARLRESGSVALPLPLSLL